jgi:hypothetical protein
MPFIGDPWEEHEFEDMPHKPVCMLRLDWGIAIRLLVSHWSICG